MRKIVILVFIMFLFLLKIGEAQPNHPHLFFNNTTISLLRAKASDTSINNLGYSSNTIWNANVITPAKSLLTGPNYFSLPSGYWTDASRDIEKKLVQLSLAYAIEDNITYAEKLKNLTIWLANMDNWTSPYLPCRPNSCLDTAHISSGVAIAYDMIFNILNESEKTLIRDAIINKGIKPMHNDSIDMPYWYNFYALHTTGIGLSTVAILDEDPRTTEWLEYAINSTKNYFEANGRDSGTYEGQLYGAYSMNHLVSFMEALLFNNGTNLYEHPFIQNLYKFAIYFVSPDGSTSANFEDTRIDGLSWSTALSSIASRTNNPYAQWYVAKRKRLQTNWWPFYLIMGNLWFNNSITPISPENNLPNSYSFNDVGHVALRTGWDNDDWLLAFKSGPYIAGHQHLCQNSFLLNLESNWLLTDPGYIDSSSTARVNFTYGTVGHNTILVDENFQKARNGSIENFFTSDYYDYILGEAGETYDNLDQFSRHVLFIKPKYFLILDDIKSSVPHQYTWLYHTDQSGKVLKDSDNYFIEKGSYRILIKQASSSDLTYNITRYPGAEYFGYYLESKNQISQNNINSVTLLYPKEASSFNLLFNPTFYFSDAGWTKNKSANGNISLDSINRRSSVYSEKINSSAIDEINYVYQTLSVNSNLNYTSYAWIKTESVEKGAFIRLEYWDSSNNYLGEEKSTEIKGTNDWIFVTFNSKPPSQASKVNFILELQGNGTAWFDDTLFADILNIELKPIYYSGDMTGAIINYENTTDTVIINPENVLSNYQTSIGNISSDGEMIILRNPENLESFAIMNGTQIYYNDNLIFESNLKSSVNFIDNETHYNGFTEITSPETIKLYVKNPVSNIFVNGIKIDYNQFSYNNETKVLTFNVTV